MTAEAVDELGLQVGDEAVCVVKATNVIVEVPVAQGVHGGEVGVLRCVFSPSRSSAPAPRAARRRGSRPRGRRSTIRPLRAAAAST